VVGGAFSYVGDRIGTNVRRFRVVLAKVKKRGEGGASEACARDNEIKKEKMREQGPSISGGTKVHPQGKDQDRVDKNRPWTASSERSCMAMKIPCPDYLFHNNGQAWTGNMDGFGEAGETREEGMKEKKKNK